jgi:hypothetical protein
LSTPKLQSGKRDEGSHPFKIFLLIEFKDFQPYDPVLPFHKWNISLTGYNPFSILHLKKPVFKTHFLPAGFWLMLPEGAFLMI